MLQDEPPAGPDAPEQGVVPGAPHAAGPALRDAEAVAERASPAERATLDAADASDAAAAARARARLRTEGLRPLVPDERVAGLLDAGEFAVAVHASATVDRREPDPGARMRSGVPGTLVLTNRRLVLVGRQVLAIELDAIREAVSTEARLLLSMADGRGVMIEVEGPRLLRVEIAAARAALRG